MSKKLIVSALIAFVVLAIGCAVPEGNNARKSLCSSDWYSLVEKQIPTGDAEGHGPDPGSTEWRSVVEFKLGIRGDPGVPPLDTDQWCDYLDKNYVRQRQ
ncbi:MAG: hypothetical protein GY792_25560 [Gammaproteobacteria bacterium]|nr:hypothetical protein [Gammaproteobacteria bacterium]